MPRSAPSLVGWKLQVFRVRDEGSRRHIVEAFRRIARPGVVVSEEEIHGHPLVVIECGSLVDDIHARRVVMAIDPGAVPDGQRSSSASTGAMPSTISRAR